jgi:hypothetical protein
MQRFVRNAGQAHQAQVKLGVCNLAQVLAQEQHKKSSTLFENTAIGKSITLAF